MQYKGFVAQHYFAIDARVYVGEIINVPDVIAFSAESLVHLAEVMKNAVDNYLDFHAMEYSDTSFHQENVALIK